MGYGCLLAIIHSDIRDRLIPDWGILILFLLNCVSHFENISFLYQFVLGISLIFLKFIIEIILNRSALGWGDIKLIFVLSHWIYLENLSIFFIYSGIFGMIWGISHILVSNEAIFPFAPSLILSFLFTSNNFPF